MAKQTAAPTNNPIENYQATVNANPNSAEAHSNLGWGYYGQKQFAEALKAFQEALRLNPKLVDAHYGRALALKESGAKIEAVAAFEQVAALAPLMEDTVRAGMLLRLAHGHINQINKGDWGLAKELYHREG